MTTNRDFSKELCYSKYIDMKIQVNIVFLQKKYFTWDGIEKQLKLGNKIIYYADYRDIPSGYSNKICKMRIIE